MACEAPIHAYRPATGGPLNFQIAPPKDGRAYIPIKVPCGTCILCREEQARQWAVRITHEAQLHDENSFVTLTLKDDNVPADGSLNYHAQMQPFWNRLRYHLGKVRYFAVGEYGDKSQRPHYHAAVFGHAFLENRSIVQRHPHLLWTCPLLEEAWGLGEVRVGALTYETARYTASYITKKLRAKQQYVTTDEATGELIPLEQPRAYMSKGIARDWLNEFGNETFWHDRVVINGRPQKPPKYYDRWLEKRSPIALQMIKEGREKAADKAKTKDAHARAEIARARAKRKSKIV